MIISNVDASGRLLTMIYSQHVGVGDMTACLGTVRDLMAVLKQGFTLLTDLTGLESMDPACAHDVGAMMDLFQANGLDMVIRVIPDPSKDIGFAIIARFHAHPRVRTLLFENLADAIQSLAAAIPPGAMAVAPDTLSAA